MIKMLSWSCEYELESDNLAMFFQSGYGTILSFNNFNKIMDEKKGWIVHILERHR